VSRSWWALLLAMGPLVGVSFIHAVRVYGEVSGFGGTAAGVGEALSPLIGVWAPTFSACELAAVFLLPFVAIRMIAADRQSGALKLELQQGMSPWLRLCAKTVVALVAWLIAMAPAISALALWKWYGGTLYGPEMAALVGGHVLNAALTIALGAAAASLTEHPSTAAIVTLGVTVGTWILNFFGAIQGGIWERLAEYTPAAIVGEFQHGLVRASTVLVCIALALFGLAISAVWTNPGTAWRRRAVEAALVCGAGALAVAGATYARPSWDLSESRGNSFPVADERALRQIRAPLRIEVHLAAEDPRRSDLERQALSKLRRLLPDLRVDYVAGTSIGLFEQTREGYGEVRYFLGGRSVTSRATTAEAVLESIYSLAEVAPAKEPDEAVFRGHPLAVQPSGAGAWFYAGWPLLTIAAAFFVRWRLK
jgi:hypothetical protein